jgi:hypothetical protein
MLPGPDEGRGVNDAPLQQWPDAPGRGLPPSLERPGARPYARLVIIRADGSHDVAWLLGPGPPDLRTVDTLARLQLVCRRGGDRLRLEEVSDVLGGLLELIGLRGEFERQAESGEELLGLEEGMDAGDSVP